MHTTTAIHLRPKHMLAQTWAMDAAILTSRMWAAGLLLAKTKQPERVTL